MEKLGAQNTPGLCKDKFSLAQGTVSRCRHWPTIFLLLSQGGVWWGAGGEKKARKKGKLNPHVLNLLKGPDSKLEMQLGLQSWLSGSSRAPSLLPGSQAAPAEKI